jgi:hypothetical protein
MPGVEKATPEENTDQVWSAVINYIRTSNATPDPERKDWSRVQADPAGDFLQKAVTLSRLGYEIVTYSVQSETEVDEEMLPGENMNDWASRTGVMF